MTMPHLQKVQLNNGETIAYRIREGGEKIILLLHGNMTSSVHWDIFFESYSKKYTLVAIDMRGFGESSYNERISSIKDFSEDLKLFIETCELTIFAMIGWSTGGAVAMQFVADYADCCSKLILLASASTRGYPFYDTKPDGTPDFLKRLQSKKEIESDASKTIPIQRAYESNNRELLRTVWNSLIYTHNQPEKARYERYIDDMVTQRNLADVYHALNTFNISSSHNGLQLGSDQAKDISIPVLILRGDRDLVITTKMTNEIAEDLESVAVVEELKNCGHSPLIDDIDQLNGKIIQFIEA
ncbi:alpha/beta fold hydrolase [Metabacillus litoralis]|uniref:intracellular short-chain-length polyhydroxyalkanoate depolymerase n=1 Tax=Metabacillus litoralis TaxID=152268 RepID=UPI001CFEBABC|nr:alpha/beta hydrolase [Metabacillus litoralis]